MFLKYISNIKSAGFNLVKAIVLFKPLPVLVSIDFLVNAVWGGDPEETISSRAGKLVRAGDRGFAYVLCRMLNWFQKDHCVRNIQASEGSDELIVLDRGAVIGTILFFTWPYYAPYIKPILELLI